MQELDHKAMGLRIRKQRTFLNMSREELAKKLDITPTFLADIELGTKGFSLKSLLERCPREKGRYAEEILTLFLLSHDPVE